VEEALEYDMSDFYLAGANRDLGVTINEVIANRFSESPVWKYELLIESIRKAKVFPSL
jgi:hypothetical protein